MASRIGRDGFERPKKKNVRPDRIIEKRQNWQDYLDPDEDPGLMDDEDEILIDEDKADEVVADEETKEE
jgi:hypothetical protein